MKNINKFITVMLVVAAALISCEDEDKTVFNLNTIDENVSPYVRIVGYETIIPAGDIATSSLSAVVDAPSENVASWDLSVSLESGGTVLDTVALTTVTNFPGDISIPYTDIATSLGITTADIGGGDFIRFLGTSTGTDGRIFTIDNFSASITGQPEQRQAFNFVVLVKCNPITDATLEGTWIVDQVDLYGDGWDGAFVTFEVDGTPTTYTATGSGTTHEIEVPAGTSELIISYTSGAFEEEHVFSIQTPDGDVRGDFGPNPAPCIN